jgi:hypothetical protein
MNKKPGCVRFEKCSQLPILLFLPLVNETAVSNQAGSCAREFWRLLFEKRFAVQQKIVIFL